MNTYNIHIDHTDSYTFTARDHDLMIEKGLVQGVAADERIYLRDFLEEFPDIFIGKYCVRESAYSRASRFPRGSVTVTDVV